MGTPEHVACPTPPCCGSQDDFLTLAPHPPILGLQSGGHNMARWPNPFHWLFLYGYWAKNGFHMWTLIKRNVLPAFPLPKRIPFFSLVDVYFLNCPQLLAFWTLLIRLWKCVYYIGTYVTSLILPLGPAKPKIFTIWHFTENIC